MNKDEQDSAGVSKPIVSPGCMFFVILPMLVIGFLFWVYIFPWFNYTGQ